MAFDSKHLHLKSYTKDKEKHVLHQAASLSGKKLLQFISVLVTQNNETRKHTHVTDYLSAQSTKILTYQVGWIEQVSYHRWTIRM